MTDKQHRWYLREWSAAYRVHWSGTKGGEAVTRAGRPPCPMRDRIVHTAQRMAIGREDGRLSPDLLRRACHVIATGNDCSSWALRNKQIDQVIAVFRVLARHRDVAAQMRIDATEIERARLMQAGRVADAGSPLPAAQAIPDADRKRTLWSIAHSDLPAAYVEEISRDKFGTGNWQSLPDASLQQLLITVKCRSAARAIGAAKRTSSMDTAVR